MSEDKNKIIEEQIDPKFGNLLLHWTIPEFHRHDRSIVWYTFFFVIGIALIIQAIISANYIFAVLLVLFGTFMLIQHFTDPVDVPIVILTSGIAIGNHFHEWEEIDTFAVIEEEGVKKLYLYFISNKHPLVGIDYPEELSREELRDIMLEFAVEDKELRSETLTDMIRRLYKL